MLESFLLTGNDLKTWLGRLTETRKRMHADQYRKRVLLVEASANQVVSKVSRILSRLFVLVTISDAALRGRKVSRQRKDSNNEMLMLKVKRMCFGLYRMRRCDE